MSAQPNQSLGSISGSGIGTAPVQAGVVQSLLVTGGHVHATTPALQQSLAAQQQLIGGVVVVPSLSSPQVIQPGRPSQPVIVQSMLHGRDVNELQILRAQVQQQHVSPVLTPLGASTTVASATGSTIHHLGHSPMSRGGGASPVPPLANPFQQQFMMSGNPQDQSTSRSQNAQLPSLVSQLSTQACQQQVNSIGGQVQQRRASGPRVAGIASIGSAPEQCSHSKSNLTSPLLSPERVRKRLRIEEKPAPNMEIQSKRKHICDYKLHEMVSLKESYKENLTELFFLQNGGNLMDFLTWKKRPSVQLIHFLKSGCLDSDDDEEDSQEKSINNEVKVLTTSGGTAPLTTPVAIATALPVSVAAAQQQQDQSKRPGGRHGMVFGHIQLSQPTQAPQMPGGIPLSTTAATTTVGSPAPYSSAASTPVNPTTASTMISTTAATVNSTASSLSLSGTLAKMMMEGTPSPVPGVSDVHTTNSIPNSLKSPASPALVSSRHSLSAVYDNTIGSQEAIVERAKQEAQVMQRVAELRKEGLWSSRRLPKVQEPSRNKAHWDYLLEEMQWLAADFAQERKWKKAGARKIARMITRHFQELQQKEIRAEKEEGMRLKRIASNLAKMVKEFWSNIEKVVQYKQQSRLEEKRKKALDLHLSFIVDQTEKYSSWLTEGLTTVGTASSSKSPSVCSTQRNGTDDGDFEPSESGVDDEETIDQAEAEVGDEDSTKDEIDALKRESELPLEEFLKTLPKEVLETPASLEESDTDSSGDEGDGIDADNEEEFKSGQENSEDDEDTLEEQEKHEKSTEHEQELKELQAEGEMSVEEIRKKYAAAYENDFEDEQIHTSTESEEEEEEDGATASSDTSEEEEQDMEAEDEESEEVGIDYLTKNLDVEEPAMLKESGKPNKEITDIAAAAQSIQPTGYTLETTRVKTKVPFLLKHKLREYQHVGLDWLATLHERKLNGILADEMGLGKTIQTIAVLAHLATEWGVWGPHLIVVPTSVMLNWEMELKKWCPAFKILTYYGNQKERKLKRQGWTKTNAFHICITSYKLVIQDHQSFRRKKWKYLILDEAQNIKNFKSQRWQTLLNFSSQRRLLLTGTPLQNNLMELWSLMHFLMPHIFQSHKEFKEWFANPLSGMIEGNHEYNEQLIKRLHKVLRPFLLRRLKQDVEKQMPKKYEHVVMCHLSKRQRYLYDDFMSQAKTKETLATGHFMSVINILMQLRKVCNHPNLFDPRPIQSPFQMEGLTYHTPSLVLAALRKDPLETIDLAEWRVGLAQAELTLSAHSAQRGQQLQTPHKLIEEIDTYSDPELRLQPLTECKPFVFRNTSPIPQISGRSSSPCVPVENKSLSANIATATHTIMSTRVTSSSASSVQIGGVNVVTSNTAMVSSSCVPQSLLLGESSPEQSAMQSLTTTATSATKQVLTSHPITVQIHQTQQGTRLMIPSGSLPQLPAGLIQIVQASSGQQVITATSQYPQKSTLTTPSVVSGPSITVSTVSTTSTVASVTRPVSTVTLPISSQVASSGKPVVKVLPMTTEASTAQVTSEAKSFTSTPVMATCSPSSEDVTCSTVKSELLQEKQSVFYLPSLAEKKQQLRQEVLKRLAYYNQRNCDIHPVLGQDAHNTVNVTAELPRTVTPNKCHWLSLGFVHCSRVTKCNGPWHPSIFWNQTSVLRQIVHSPEQYMQEMKELLDRFVIICPPVSAPRLQLHSSHPSPSWLREQQHREFVLKKDLGPRIACLHNISTRMTVQFPELRLIEYDCGKLQTLDLLLARLKIGDHRVLIFTQMTRMLDILEQFLSYHGHRYLRLDGTTKVEQRQILMDRFNMDKRIFCFILSTRSGGLGVNLTGADTVIFYDSDWNPTMDAQAQDRCHRIGQTRDVHIYRLISEMTVEENILKKANQKRLLGDVAIEGGNFTAAFFKQQTIKELFEEPSGLESLTKEHKKEPVEKQEVVCKVTSDSVKQPEVKPDLTEEQLEQALCAAEDETDIQAANVVKAEQKAELAEFDENIPWDEREAELKREKDEELSKVEQELAMLEKELTPVERYAVVYVEDQIAPEACEELEKAEEEVAIAKEEWELSRLQSLKEEEERRAELEEDEVLYTYSREDAYSQAYICDETGERMPVWAPPTPPQDDNDIYIDHSMCFMYEPAVMLESQLPAVYVKKEQKRIRIDPTVAVARKHRVHKEEHHRVPRSLFDRPQSLLRKERDQKLMKLKQFPKSLRPQIIQSRPVETEEAHPWMIHEDQALLLAVQEKQELPLTLTTESSAVTPNWDFVAEMVNSHSRTYRSIKQCKNRYENVIVLREEGKILYDVNPRKQKKSKGIYKTKNNRPMRTNQLYLQDKNESITKLHSMHFDSVKAVANKRTPTIRPTLANPTLKNPKHAAVLAENGINYDQPRTPKEVAANRAERIAKEKQKNQEAAQQQLVNQRAVTTQSTSVTTAHTTVVTPALTGTTVQAAAAAAAGHPMAIVQGSQLASSVSGAQTTVVVTAAALQKAAQGSAMATVSLDRTPGSINSIVVNPANQFAAINRRIAGQTVLGTVSQTLSTTSNSSIAQAVRAARAVTAPITVQELAAVVNPSPNRIRAHNTAQVITTTTLTPAQFIAAQKGGTVTVGGVPQGVMSKAMTQQLQLLRLKQQQQQAQLRHLTVQPAVQHTQTVTGVGQTGVQKSITVTTPLITSLTQPQVSSARLQLAKRTPSVKGPTMPRSISEADMAVLLKQQPLQQQRALSTATIVTQGSASVQQVQVSQGHVARLTTGQILTGAQVHQVQAGHSATVGSSGAQPVATLVKTVSTQGSANIPSVTIPVTAAVSLGISVNVPTQKSKNAHQQMRQIHLQHLQRSKPLQVATSQQKVATLGQLQQVGKNPGGATPLIIPPQQQTTTMPKVMVQHIQQMVKPQVQQFIASVSPSQTSTATVIATQLVSQAQPAIQTVTKMSVPTATASSAITQATRVPLSISGTAVSGTTHGLTLASGSLVTGSPVITHTQAQTMLVKNHQDVMSPHKPLTSGTQQLKTIHQSRQVQGVTLTQITSQTTAPTVQVQQLNSSAQAMTSTPKIIQQASPIVQHLVQPGTTVTQHVQPSPGVQQAVQKVVQEAQAQAQHRVAVTVGGTAITHPAPVTVTQSAVVVSGVQQIPSTIQSQTQGQESQGGQL